MALKALRAVAGLSSRPPALRDAALVLIDCQNIYREGVMQPTGGAGDVVSAAAMQSASVAALRDLFAVVVPTSACLA